MNIRTLKIPFSSFRDANNICRERAVERWATHQVVAEAPRPHPEVVPDDEQRQEEGQHVDLPVPDCQHEYLQGEGPRGHTSMGG